MRPFIPGFGWLKKGYDLAMEDPWYFLEGRRSGVARGWEKHGAVDSLLVQRL